MALIQKDNNALDPFNSAPGHGDISICRRPAGQHCPSLPPISGGLPPDGSAPSPSPAASLLPSLAQPAIIPPS
jgi:hypothetical protein